MSTAEMTEKDAAKLAVRVEEQIGEEAKLVEEIRELRGRETVAIEQALRAGTQSRGPGTKAESIRRTREAAERKLQDIREFEIPAARRLAAEAAEALRRAKFVTAEAKARPFDVLEAQARGRIASAYEELLRAYLALADAASGREAIYEDLEREGLLNGLDENELTRLRRVFSATTSPFPASPAALVEALEPAVLEAHAGNPEYEAHFAQTYPFAALFVGLLAEVRNAGLYRRCHLRLTTMKAAFADYNSATNDRAGGAARQHSGPRAGSDSARHLLRLGEQSR